MSTAEMSELAELLDRVKSWTPASRIVLARRILETLEASPPRESTRPARSVRELIGMGAGESSPPDDETVRRWVDEYRVGKYG